jgi:transposase
MIIVGFDWARDKHDVCIQDPAGKVLYRGTVAHRAEGLEGLRQRIASLESDPAAVRAAMEQHDGALLAWLLDAGYTVYGINPKSADRARDVFRPAGAKDDPGDALVAADLLRGNLGRYKPLHPQSHETLELRALARLHMRLVEDKTVLMQRLRGLLAEWSPAVSGLCTDLNREWQRALLTRWPLHEDLAAVHANTLKAFCADYRLCAATRKRLGAVLVERPLFVPSGRKAAVRLEIAAILEQIELLTAKLLELRRSLEEAFVAHPNYAIFNSLPVKGAPTLAMIAGAFGDRRPDPPGWRELAARWGVGPVTVASGRSRMVKRRRACDGHVLQALTDLAFTTAFSVHGCWATEYYRRKRKEGHDHHESLRAQGQRWVKILWSMWHHGTRYDEQLHCMRKGLFA